MKFSEIDRYFSIRGRASRAEFWAVAIVSCVVAIALMLVALEFNPLDFDEDTHDIFVGIIVIIGCFVTWWIQLATTARRCRDIGLTPWASLLINVPYVGLLAWIIIGLLNPKD